MSSRTGTVSARQARLLFERESFLYQGHSVISIRRAAKIIGGEREEAEYVALCELTARANPEAWGIAFMIGREWRFLTTKGFRFYVSTHNAVLIAEEEGKPVTETKSNVIPFPKAK